MRNNPNKKQPMKRILLAASLLTMLATGAKAFTPTAFTPGYLAVLQECDGGTNRCLPLGANGTTTLITNYSASDLAASRQNQIFIDQFNPNGVNQTNGSPGFIQVAIPTNGPGAMLVNGNAGTEGGLTLAGDKSVVTFSGYSGDILSITTGGQTAPSNLSYNRGICTVDAFGNYSQVYNGAGWYGVATGKTNPRGVATDGQGNFWGCGNGYGSLYFSTAPGFGQPIQFQNIALTSCSRVINGKLYSSVKSSESVNLYPAGVYSFVDFYNNPVNYPATASFLHLEIPATAPYTTCIGFDISPDNTKAYLADTTYGIQKYVKVGLTWQLAYNLSIPGYFGQTNGIMGNPGSTNVLAGCFSVTVDWSGTNPVVYATTTDSGSDTKSTYYGNRVIRINDTNTLQTGANIVVTTNMNILTTVVRPPTIGGIQLTNIAYKSVTFTPDLRPVVTNNPVGWSAVVGDSPSFSVGAFSSTGNLTYQWLQNGTNLVGQTSPTVTLSPVNLALNNATYQCVVANDYGAVTSSIAILLVFSTPQPPIVQPLPNATNYVGNSVSFTVSVTGTDAKGGYQWYLNGSPLSDGAPGNGETYSGTATAMIQITQLQTNDAGIYSVSVTNISGSTTGAVVNLTTLYAPPIIVQSPSVQTTFVGVPVNNPASAYGSLLSEQWYGAYVSIYTNTTTITVIQTNGVQLSNKTNSTAVALIYNYVTNLLTDGASYSGTATPNLACVNPQLTDSATNFLLSLSSISTPVTKLTTNSSKTIITNTTTTTIAQTMATNYAGYYSIVFTNPAGAVTSSPVALTVLVQPYHSFVFYGTNGSVYKQTFDSLPVNGGGSADSANPNKIQVETNFTVIDLTTGGPNNAYSLANPFDFAYPIIPQGAVGGLGVNNLAGWYGWSQLSPKTGGTYGFGATFGDQSAAGIIDNGQNYYGNGAPLIGVTNRALGLIANTKSGYVAFGVAIINNTASTITNISLSFVGELWRNNPLQEVLGFSYAIDPAGTNSTFTPSVDNSVNNDIASINGNPAYAVAALNVAFPANAATTINDGTQSTNQISLSTNSMAIANWTPGSALWLVWSSQNPIGGAQAVAIDNLIFTTTNNVVPATTVPLSFNPGSFKIIGSGTAAVAQFSFSNPSGLSFSVHATNKLTAPLNTWPVIGQDAESTSPGSYLFTDPNPATNGTMFYILSSP
jgi:hypothetical protein